MGGHNNEKGLFCNQGHYPPQNYAYGAYAPQGYPMTGAYPPQPYPPHQGYYPPSHQYGGHGGGLGAIIDGGASAYGASHLAYGGHGVQYGHGGHHEHGVHGGYYVHGGYGGHHGHGKFGKHGMYGHGGKFKKWK